MWYRWPSFDFGGKDFLFSAFDGIQAGGPLGLVPLALMQPSLFPSQSLHQVQRPLDRLFCSVVTVAEQKFQSTLW